MPADGKGAKGGDVMTKTHATGAAVSYGMRYLLKMIFNVAVGEDDTDGNGPRETPDQPVGYEDWVLDMAATAENGWPALSDAWKQSKKEYRAYATKHDAERWSGLRQKAEQVRS